MLGYRLCICIQCLSVFVVTTAEITNTAALFSSKPDAYVELTLDGQTARKTEIAKKTCSPKWDEIFTVYVSLLPCNPC